MVTQPSRRAHLRRALSDYAWQTYPWRELVVCDEQHAGDADGVLADLAALGRDDVRCVTPSGRLTLGALRNVGWASASGEVTLQLDDDDRYHPDRIAVQAGAWQRAGTLAVFLTEVMHYDPRVQTIGVTNWVQSPPGCFPGSLHCARDAPVCYPEVGEAARNADDSAMVAQLRALDGLHGLTGAPYLYVYTAHGANTMTPAHMAMLAGGLGQSRGLLLRREEALRQDLAPFWLSGVTVQGANDPAFTL